MGIWAKFEALGGGGDPAGGVRGWWSRGGVSALRVGDLLQGGQPAAGGRGHRVPPEVGPVVRALRAGPVFQGGAGASCGGDERGLASGPALSFQRR